MTGAANSFTEKMITCLTPERGAGCSVGGCGGGAQGAPTGLTTAPPSYFMWGMERGFGGQPGAGLDKLWDFQLATTLRARHCAWQQTFPENISYSQLQVEGVPAKATITVVIPFDLSSVLQSLSLQHSQPLLR